MLKASSICRASIIQGVNQQHESRTVQTIKVAPMKNTDSFVNYKWKLATTNLTLFTFSIDEWDTKGGHIG